MCSYHSAAESYRYDYLVDGTPLGNRGYHGQVLLYPPASYPEGVVYQASMGIVGVKEEGDGDEFWRYVSKGNDIRVNQAVANTLCRQMGYTNVDPSSIITRLDAERIYGYDFSHWDPVM